MSSRRTLREHPRHFLTSRLEDADRGTIIPAMVGYSGTPLPQKLGIKADHRVAVVGAPTGFARTLGTLPPGATAQDGLAGALPLDVIVVFVTERTRLVAQLAATRPRMAQAAGLWIA